MSKLTKGKLVKKTKKVNKVKSKQSNTKNRKHLKKESSLHKSSKTKKVNHKKKRYNLNKNNRKNKTVKRKKNHQVKKVVRNLKNKFINRTQKYVVSKSKQVGGSLEEEFNSLMDKAKGFFNSNFLGVVGVPIQIDDTIKYYNGLLFVQVFGPADLNYSIYTFVNKTDMKIIKAIEDQFSDNNNILDITVFFTDLNYIVRLKKENCKQLFYKKMPLHSKGEVYIFYKDDQPNLSRDFVIPANDKNTDALENNQQVDMKKIRTDLGILTPIKNEAFIQILITNFITTQEGQFYNKFYGHQSLFQKPPTSEVEYTKQQKCDGLKLLIKALTAEIESLDTQKKKKITKIQLQKIDNLLNKKNKELVALVGQKKRDCTSGLARLGSGISGIGSSLKRTLKRASRKSSSSSPPPPGASQQPASPTGPPPPPSPSSQPEPAVVEEPAQQLTTPPR